MKNIAIVIVLIVVVVGSLVYFTGTSGDQSAFFQEELIRAGKERVGQPIEGFNAFIYLEAFPGLKKSDFDEVKSLEGIYKAEGEELKYVRTAGNPVTSAEETISEDGYKTLLKNLSKRLDIRVRSEEDVATLLEMLREEDPKQSSYIGDDFSIWFPEGWYPYKNNRSVFFTHDENLKIPANTDGFAMAPWAQVTVKNVDIEEMFAKNLWVEGSEFLVSKEKAVVSGMEMIRVVTVAAGAEGEVLHYVFDSDDGRVFTLSHYPYERGSKDTDDFEQAVRNFDVNYTINSQGEVISGWNTYKNEQLGFAIDYPPGWQYRERRPEESISLIVVFGERVPSEDYPVLIYQGSKWSKPIGQTFWKGSLVIDISIDETEPLAQQMISSFRFVDN